MRTKQIACLGSIVLSGAPFIGGCSSGGSNDGAIGSDGSAGSSMSVDGGGANDNPDGAIGSDGSGGSSMSVDGGGANDNPYRRCDGEFQTNNSCPIPDSLCDPRRGCMPPSSDSGVCPSPPAGTMATPASGGPHCVLDCLPTKQGDPPFLTCPSGMMCGGNGFCVSYPLTPYGLCVEQNKRDVRFCQVLGSVCDPNWGCSPPCPNGTADCPDPPSGGTATKECSAQECRLSCADGKTCPAGMYCNQVNLICRPGSI